MPSHPLRPLIAALVTAAMPLAAITALPQAASAAAPVQPQSLTVTMIHGSAVAGYTPGDIASAYDLSGGAAAVVGVVVPYSYAPLASDLAVYRAQWGLPSCTQANGCLRIVGQDGGSDLPGAPQSEWDVETMLDVEAVSAACPACSIVVAEADTPTLRDLGAAVDAAVAQGADAVSMSWGQVESDDDVNSSDFVHPGVALVAASGDDGYYGTGAGALAPAALPNVISVGGTTLTRSAASPALRTGSALQVEGGRATSLSASDLAAQHRAQLARAQADLASAERASSAANAAVAAAKARLASSVAAQHRAALALRAAQSAARSHPSAAHRSAVAAAGRTAASTARTATSTAAALRHLQSAGKQAEAAVAALTAAVRAAAAQVAADQRAAAPPVASAPAPTTASTARPGWSESAWSDAGSGCSTLVAAPSWQTGTACGSARAVSDLAADADPATGLAVYASGAVQDGYSDDGWLLVGGTSLAAPLVAGMIARSGHAAAYGDASPIWQNPQRFWDVTTGSSGSCSGSAVCTAGAGWDGPTGVGTPRSLASF